MSQQDRGTGKNEQGQRVTKPPRQTVFDDIPDIGPAGGNARYRRDMVGLQRVLHSEQKAKPQNSEHTRPDLVLRKPDN